MTKVDKKSEAQQIILLMAPKKGAHYNYSNSEWPQVPTYFLEFYYDILGNTEVKKNCTIRRIVIGNQRVCSLNLSC